MSPVRKENRNHCEVVKNENLFNDDDRKNLIEVTQYNETFTARNTGYKN